MLLDSYSPCDPKFDPFALSLTVTKIAFLVKAPILIFFYKIFLIWLLLPLWSQIWVLFTLSLTVTEVPLMVKVAILNLFIKFWILKKYLFLDSYSPCDPKFCSISLYLTVTEIAFLVKAAILKLFYKILKFFYKILKFLKYL